MAQYSPLIRGVNRRPTIRRGGRRRMPKSAPRQQSRPAQGMRPNGFPTENPHAPGSARRATPPRTRRPCRRSGCTPLGSREWTERRRGWWAPSGTARGSARGPVCGPGSCAGSPCGRRPSSPAWPCGHPSGRRASGRTTSWPTPSGPPFCGEAPSASLSSWPRSHPLVEVDSEKGGSIHHKAPPLSRRPYAGIRYCNPRTGAGSRRAIRSRPRRLA
jgi:hypothetical protein